MEANYITITYIGLEGIVPNCSEAGCDGLLTWFDGTPFNYADAGYGTFTANGGTACWYRMTSGMISDCICSSEYHYVCEVKA